MEIAPKVFSKNSIAKKWKNGTLKSDFKFFLKYMSLANKYRPQTFDEMIGQEHIIDILKAQMMARDSVHHNYLLFGPRGTGKTTTARLIAKGINCLNLQNGNPCNRCDACKLINEGASLDYVEIDAASHTGVDNIREEIIDKALYPPTALRKKIYVIDEVHMLSKGAFNALLKTIEEPKSDVCFIFATTELHKVPDTIISRCQVFNYRKVAQDAMVAHLEKICSEEGLKATHPALEIIANISEGHVRDAVKYIDQVSILWEIDEDNVSKFLWVAGEGVVRDFFKRLEKGNKADFFELLDQIDQKGIDLVQFAKQVIVYADQHLLENMDFYLQISQKLGELLGVVRRYPHPRMAYKIVFNAFLEGESGSVKTDRSPQTASSIKKDEKSDSQPQSLIANEEKVQISASSADKKSHSESNNESSMSLEASDPVALWKRVLGGLKPTAQVNLSDGAVIEKILEDEVEIITISSIAKMLLNNQENVKLIESALNAELGHPVKLLIKNMSKDEYFAMKMGQ